jgi:hypothetical protein
MVTIHYPWSIHYPDPVRAIDIFERAVERMDEADSRLARIAEAGGIDKEPQFYWDDHNILEEHLARMLKDRTKIRGIERHSMSVIAKHVSRIVIMAHRGKALEALAESVPIIGEDVSFERLKGMPNAALIYFPFRFLRGVHARLGLMKKNMKITRELYTLMEIEAQIEGHREYVQNPGYEESNGHRAFWRKRISGSFEGGKRR